MARIRTIRPDFVELEYIGRLTIHGRYLYLVMKPQCDDAGRIRADSRKLARTLYPYDDDAVTLINAWLADLVRNGCAIVYEVARCRFLQLVNFNSEERIDRPSRSSLPAPDEGEHISAQALLAESPLASHRNVPASSHEVSRLLANAREDSRVSDSVAEQILEENPREGSRGLANCSLGKEGKGREGRGIGGGVGEPSVFDLTGNPPAGGRPTRQKATTKLPNPYPLQAEHERIGLEVLPKDADVPKLFSVFTAYWHSNGKLKADWIATWRVWCHRAATSGDYPRKAPEPADGPAPNRSGLDWYERPAAGSKGNPPRQGGA